MSLFHPADTEPEDIERDVLLFCPRCKNGPSLTTALCPNCGDRAVSQGYCAVCECYWHLPIGGNCPKHDIELGEPPQTPLVFKAGEPAPDWVTIGRYPDSLAASVPRMRLEAEGIPTFIVGERMGGQSMYRVATGGVSLQVPRPLLADARVLLDQSWQVPEDPEGLDDAWDELAPAPGTFRRSVMRKVIVLVLIGPFLLALIATLLRSLKL